MATLARSIAEVKAEKADAVVVMGHMGWRFQDDYANPVRELLTKVDGVDIFLAGHSHQDQPYFMVKDVICSQASYYGIHCGRVDLTFDLDSRKLLDRKAFTVRMDSRFELDPLVMEVAKADLDVADEQMQRKVWEAKEKITGSGRGSQLWAIMCTAFAESLKKHQQPVDGIFHGTFNTGDEDPGVKTVGDVWRWLPYENELTVADLSGADLIEIMKESRSFKKSDRELWPFKLDMDKDGKVNSFTLADKPVEMTKKYCIGMNSYDAQSGGKDLNKLADLVSRQDARRVDTGLPTREALIDYLLSLS
jgi:5'-nucleotidase / UDP-sugar diphosphatase